MFEKSRHLMRQSYLLVFIFLVLISSFANAQENYWQPEFISNHNIASISKFKETSKGSEKELILKIEYNFNGKELQRWQKDAEAIHLTINDYDQEGRLQKSTRFYQDLNQAGSSLDTIQFSEFLYPKDSMQERISWTPRQAKSEAGHYLFSLKKINEIRNRKYFGEPTYNEEGQLIEDHWGFQQREVSGCIISTTGDLFYRQFNYDEYDRLVSETWFKNGRFFRTVSYFKNSVGLPKYEYITEYTAKEESISNTRFSYIFTKQ